MVGDKSYADQSSVRSKCGHGLTEVEEQCTERALVPY